MSIKKIYHDYLKHFQKTVTLAAFNSLSADTNLITLRHDVDHDIDIALEMSYWEHRYGIKATYFILPGSSYWSDSELVNKCLQIQDFGHEIGLHVNVLAEWFQGLIKDPSERLDHLLSKLRTDGIKITGVSAHGDHLCYKRQFINYWLFRELRPDNPEYNESGLSAEGIASIGDRPSIAYPKDHTLVRDDGISFSLWSVPMQRLGLDYHAVHVLYDRYFTDSGGEWDRSPDPLEENLSQGRHQVLIHPEYWRGPQKLFFFLSTARSGSKWLATVLNEASSLKSRHEFLLNHRLKAGRVVADKRTADGFTELQDAPNEALDLLLEIRPWIEELDRDYAEVNVYLGCFLDEIAKAFPEAIMIHLHRQPYDVIRSIINRNWYDTPEDNRHPRFDLKNWPRLNQFQCACWYVRMINENLIGHCIKRLSFRQMVTSPETLTKFLNELGIAFYPRMAKPFFREKINAATCDDFPGYQEWRLEQKQYYHEVCDEVNKPLGYATAKDIFSVKQSKPKLKTIIKLIRITSSDLLKRFFNLDSSNPQTVHKTPIELPVNILSGTPSVGIHLNKINSELEIFPKAKQNVHFLFGGGSWYEINKQHGWHAQLAYYYRGKLEAELSETTKGTARMICLMYDKSGKLLSHRSLVRLRHGKKKLSFSFRPGSAVNRFNLALYMPKNDLPNKVIVTSLCLEKLPLGYEW